MRAAIASYGVMAEKTSGKKLMAEKIVRNKVRADGVFVRLRWMSPPVRFAIPGNASHE
jgi:hypothetical protein